MLCILGLFGSECLHSMKILMGITDKYVPKKSWSIAVAKYMNILFEQYTDLCVFKKIFFSVGMLVSVFSSNYCSLPAIVTFPI